MSWQQYVDETLLGSGVVKQGGILGSDGEIWAHSPGLKLSESEGASLAAGFDDPSGLYSNGVKVNGVKFTVLRVSPEVLHAKKGAEGVICARSTQAIVIALYDGSVKPEPVNQVVEGLADYLRSSGY